MKVFEDGFVDFKRYIETNRHDDAATTARLIYTEIKEAEIKEENDEHFLMQIFDMAYKNSFLGCSIEFLAKGDLDALQDVLSVIRKMSFTKNQSIISEIHNCGVTQAIFSLIYQADGSEKYDNVVYSCFTCLSNIISDSEEIVKLIVDSPEVEKVVQKGLFLKDREDPRDGFIQFLSALCSTDYQKVRCLITSEVIDVIMVSIKTRSPERVHHIIDGVGVLQYLTDNKIDDEEKSFAGAVNYLIDKGFYQIAFDAICDDQLPPSLSTICARAIGNSLCLDNYPDIDRVIYI